MRRVAVTVAALREVQEGRADLAVVRHSLAQEGYFADLVGHGGLSAERIWEYDAQLTLHTSHPLAKSEQVEAAQLQSWPELFFWNDELLRRPGAGERRVFFADRLTLPGLLAATKGYLWATPLCDEDMSQRGLVQRPCTAAGDSSLRWRDVLIYPKNERFGPIYRRFVDLLYESRNALAFE